MADIQGISSVCRQNSEILTEGKKSHEGWRNIWTSKNEQNFRKKIQ